MIKNVVSRLAALCLVLAACEAGASPVTYDVIFAETYTYTGIPTTQSATFVFDSTTQLFSNFLFTLQGNTYDVTAAANNAYLPLCNPTPIVGNLGFAIMSGATHCTYEQRWFVYSPGRNSAELAFFATNTPIDNPTSPGPGPTIDTTLSSVGDFPAAIGGSFRLVAEPAGSAVPEPASIALLGLGLIAATSTTRRRRPGRR